MESQPRKHSLGIAALLQEPACTNPSCFFCTMNEQDPSLRKAKLAKCFKEIPVRDDQEHVLVLSGIWNIAMTQPDDPEFPSLGIFECMGKLIQRAINDKDWLLRDQNIYIPYYAAHIIGSYTMNKVQFAEKAVKSGVVLPLIELLRGKISWIEQRVAVRALGHLASHDRTFEPVAEHEVEVIALAMKIACNCIKTIYRRFISVKDSKRLKYQSDLLTTGLEDSEIENRKAEEWASQLQYWSLYLLNCFACKGRSLNLICKKQFLKELCGMWGGLANRASPGGIGLIRTLCNFRTGRESLANSTEVIESLCNISRSSDDCQNMAIDCLLLLLKDRDTRYEVIDIAAISLVDLVELRSLNEKKRVGEAITQTLLQDYHKIKFGDLKLKSKEAERALKETWDLMVERRKKEKLMSEQELKERKHMVGVLKQDGNKKFWSGDIEKAVTKYTKALDLCSLKMKKERIVLYSNRAQGYLLLNNPEAVISDTTRALCLSSAGSPHKKSLWRRAQAYDMKGLAKESLMDCLMFIHGRMKAEQSKTKHAKVPYFAARMIHKQMNATWLFAAVAKSKDEYEVRAKKFKEREHEDIVPVKEIKERINGLPDSMLAELLIGRERRRTKQVRSRRRTKAGAITAEVPQVADIGKLNSKVRYA